MTQDELDGELRGFGRGPEGLIEAKIYPDGDVTVTHGERGQCRDMSGVSGYDPLLDALSQLDVPHETGQEVLDFVDESDLV